MKRPIPFGKYYLLERINVGGMAEVFRAKAYGVEGFERLLAVKRILPNIAEDEEFIEMFIDEAKIAVQLNHANIAQIFDLGKVDDSYFIALEYVHGRDLRAIFDRCVGISETMPIPQACFIIMKVCEGLDYAHNKRDGQGREMHLVHRDVSPQNILISYEGEVKLVDFGIAKAAGKASKTQAGILKGKFGYMSPEQVRGLPLDRRSDIFSVGIVLYELLTGERLFLGESDFSTLEKVRNVEILPPSTYNRKVGEELEQIVLKALAKDVEDRYQNAIDLHDDLQAYMYTSGDFYSRKDLAAWMKQTFTGEIREEAKKLEEYRQMPVPEPTGASSPSVATASHQGVVPPPPPPVPGGNGHSGAMSLPRVAPTVEFPSDDSVDVGRAPTALGWDDEEVETQIYDKPSVPSAELSIPEPIEKRDEIPNRSAPASAPSDRPSVSSPSMPPARAATESMSSPRAVSLSSFSNPVLPSAPTVDASLPPVRRIVPPATSEVISTHHTKSASPRARSSRFAFVVAAAVLVFALLAGGAYYIFVYGTSPGALVLTTIPSDVEVYVDGKKQKGKGSPMTIGDLKPGFYILTVRQPGYESWGKTVEIKPGETARETATLEVLATASIELRTRPPGGVAYLDGRRLSGVTPMKITQITPGRHRLEVRRSPGYNPWIHEFDIQPDQTLKLHQKLLPLQVPVKIASVPRATAFVVRDGQREPLGRTPIDIKLNPKYAYQVVIEREGYREWTQSIQFDGDTPVRIAATLAKSGEDPTPEVQPPKVRTKVRRVRPKKQPKHHRRTSKKPPKTKVAMPPPPRPTVFGLLQVNSKPWTRIAIDGRDTGLNTPQLGIRLPVGRHQVTLSNTKFNINKTFSVTIRADRPTRLVKKFLK